MNSLSEIVDVVIGVDTHVATHSAAAVDVRTGGVLGELTVDATPDGYAELVRFADEHSHIRAWAIEGTGGHGAGLARHLHAREELVVELDRPERAKRRSGAKSDPLDAIRAAREALARTKLDTPRATGERQALSVLLAARRSAVVGSGDAQRQLFSLVIAAPEVLRSKFRDKKVAQMVRTAARLTHSRSDSSPMPRTLMRTGRARTGDRLLRCRTDRLERDPRPDVDETPRPIRLVTNASRVLQRARWVQPEASGLRHDLEPPSRSAELSDFVRASLSGVGGLAPDPRRQVIRASSPDPTEP